MLRILRALTAAVACGALIAPAQPAHATSPHCPSGGTIRFGIEPFETAAKLQPIFDAAAKAIGAKLGCDVQVFVTTSYNAEIEAMRAGKLEVGEFGPLGYVLANKIAHAEAVATYANAKNEPSTYTASIVTNKSTGLGALKDVAGKSFAFSDPASTSGHLFPAYALKKVGIDPDTGVKAVYAGSHTASYEAIRNAKVEAAELNSEMIASAQASGNYNAGQFVTLWRSDPIPTDPIAVRADLSPTLKKKLADAFLTLDLTPMDPNNVLKGFGHHFVPTSDHAYDGIRDLVSTLNINLDKL